MRELEKTISLVLVVTLASIPLEQVHHRQAICSRGAVDLVLTILFQAHRFLVQATPRKGPESGQNLLLTISHGLILSVYMTVDISLGKRH